MVTNDDLLAVCKILEKLKTRLVLVERKPE